MTFLIKRLLKVLGGLVGIVVGIGMIGIGVLGGLNWLVGLGFLLGFGSFCWLVYLYYFAPKGVRKTRYWDEK